MLFLGFEWGVEQPPEFGRGGLPFLGEGDFFSRRRGHRFPWEGNTRVGWRLSWRRSCT